MEAKDVVWGSKNKIFAKLSIPYSLKVGSFVNIDFYYENEQYVLSFDEFSSSLLLQGIDKDILDNLFSEKQGRNLLVKVLNFENNSELILEICAFTEVITLNELQAISIFVPDDILKKSGIEIEDGQTAADFFSEKFKFENMVFIRGSGRVKNEFVIYGSCGEATVARVNNVFRILKLKTKKHAQRYYDAVAVMRGGISFVDVDEKSSVTPDTQALLDEFNRPNEYMKIWEIYNRLEGKYLQKQYEQYGTLQYKGYSIELRDNYEYHFNIVGGDNNEFPTDLQICVKKNIDSKSEYLREEDEQFISVGRFAGIKNGKCIVIDEVTDNEKYMPEEGFLVPSQFGDKVRLRRREKAQFRLRNNMAPIRHLSQMIAEGCDCPPKHREMYRAITRRLEKRFKNKKFNALQQRAIAVALNTPDIGLILGPPGTGKTTVIRAIIARFEEEFHKKYADAIPRVLVTSFQHEAVDNVMSGIEGNGLPANRIGGKGGKIENVEASLKQWVENTATTIAKTIKELGIHENFFDSSLKDRFWAWRKKGRNKDEGLLLLQDYIKELESMPVVCPGLQSAQKLVLKLSVHPDGQKSRHSPENNRCSILINQRLTPESFADDGYEQAYMLQLEFDAGTVEYKNGLMILKAVMDSDGFNLEAFQAYVRMVEVLKAKYVQENECLVPVNVEDEIEGCIEQLSKDLIDAKLKDVDNKKVRTARVLNEYLDEIQTLDIVQELVTRYSNINASTCQQVMSRYNTSIVESVRGETDVYDLVVIDEAARANPLDLLIPMVYADKIILVGDFMQLPHMLEPGVVDEYLRDDPSRTNEYKELKQSLFERLYRFYDRQGVTVQRTARLSQQYRMNSTIGEFVGEAFYKEYNIDSSEVDDSIKQANLGLYENKSMVWINLDRGHFRQEQGKISKFREPEAKVVVDHARNILKIDPNKTIGIIAFYKAQAELIQNRIEEMMSEDQKDQISVGTVDAFQGKEFDVVFLSCVRSNNYPKDNWKAKVGHIADKSRLCVALTRARQLLVAVGDRETISCVPVLKDFIDICENGEKGYYVEEHSQSAL